MQHYLQASRLSAGRERIYARRWTGSRWGRQPMHYNTLWRRLLSAWIYGVLSRWHHVLPERYDMQTDPISWRCFLQPLLSFFTVRTFHDENKGVTEMNLPGFTAEQSLKQHQGIYSQRSMSLPVEAAGEVRPQFIRDFLIRASSRCCLDGNLGCCRLLGELLADALGG